MTRIFAFISVVALAGACDPLAKAGGSNVVSDEQVSRSGETCGSSLHCQTGLRCIRQVCVAEQQSRLADLYAAAGDLAASRGQIDRATDAFSTAVTRYEEAGAEVPARVWCAHGHALLEQRRDRTKAELAARVLHKCVLQAPPGSTMRAQAMRDLAVMLDVGLDPELIDRDEPADAYLNKAPSRPATDKLSLTATPVGAAPRSRTFAGWLAVLGEDTTKAALLPCWEDHWKKTRQKTLDITLELKYSFRLDEFDDFDRATLAVTSASGEAGTCVADKLAAIADDYSKGAGEARWSSKIQLILK